MTSCAQMQETRASGSLRPMPLLVLPHDRWPAPEERLAGRPIAEEEQIFRELNLEFVHLVPDGRHVIAEGRGHNIRQEQPELVVGAIREAGEAVRDPDTRAKPAGARPTRKPTRS